MRIRFQADADLDGRVVRGLRRAVPEIDIRNASQKGLAGLSDLDVLRIAAEVIVSSFRRTEGLCRSILPSLQRMRGAQE